MRGGNKRDLPGQDDLRDEAGAGDDRTGSSSSCSSSGSTSAPPSASPPMLAADRVTESKSKASPAGRQMEKKGEAGDPVSPKRTSDPKGGQSMSTIDHESSSATDHHHTHDSTASGSLLENTPPVRGHDSGDDSEPEFIEVVFEPTGPLGITFEWAEDPTRWLQPALGIRDGTTARLRESSCTGKEATLRSPRDTAPILKSAVLSQHPQETAPVRVSGASTAACPGTPLAAPILPPILPYSTGELPEPLAPHALRIQSFPVLPTNDSNRLDETGASTTVVAANDWMSAGGTYPPPAAATALRRDHGSDSGGDTVDNRGDRPDPNKAGLKGAVLEGRRGLTESGKSAQPRPVRKDGPAAGRGTLRPGDILIEVNGTPVAGPAARQAGIASFRDVVDVVAATATRAGKEALRPRVLKFRRSARLSPPFPPPAPTSLHIPPPLIPLRGEWAREVSGTVVGGAELRGGGGGHASSTEASLSPSPRSTHPSLARSSYNTGCENGVELESRGVLGRISPRSISSIGSDRSSGSSSNRKLSRLGKGRTGGSRKAPSVVSIADQVKEESRVAEAGLQPWVCPQQQLLKEILEKSLSLQPVAVRLTNLSYWYQQRRLLGGFRHSHRKTVFDPRTKRWEASLYRLGDRPSDGKLVPILTRVGPTFLTEGQAWAQAIKSAKERDANPAATHGPKPRGLTPSTLLQTHYAILVVSEAFMGLSHADRLALVFTSLYDGLEAASSPCPTPRSSAVFPAGASRTTVLERAEGKSRGDAAAVSLSQSCSPRGVSRCYGKGKPRAGGERRGKPGEESQQNERPQSDRNPVSVDTVGAGSEEGGQNKNRRVLRGRVKASYVGSNVEALPVWGGLDTIAGCSLLVECRTPAQWRAGEFQPSGQELWGPSRSGHRTLANNPRLKEAAMRKGLEKLVAESKALREAAPKFEHFDRFVEDQAGKTPPRLAPQGSLGLGNAEDNAGNTATSPKSGGAEEGCNAFPAGKDGGGVGGHTHPHFFHGLGPNARQLFIELYAENRSRLLAPRIGINTTLGTQEGIDAMPLLSAPSDGSSLPELAALTGVSGSPLPAQSPGPSPRAAGRGISERGGGRSPDTVRQAASAFAAVGPPADLDAGILDQHGVLFSRLTEVATRLQRLRRLGALPRAARRLRCRQRAALALQRFFRGHLDRRYAALWKLVSGLASTKLSAAWRRFYARRAFLEFRARARAGAIVIQAIFRGHVGRRFAAYCATYYNAARAIQSGARGFLARCRTRSARAARTWVLCGLPALLLIQRVVRGFLVRKAFARRFEEAVRVRVVIPAAGVLQKCWRGRLGRNDAALRRKMKAAATEIQRHCRGFVRRRWWARVLYCRMEHAMATRIAAKGRGYIDRQLVKHRRAQRYFIHTIKPAAVLLQSQWRGYTKRRDLAEHKRRWLAALFIQVAYRGAVFRKLARIRYQAWMVLHRGFSAQKIQCLFRRWRACRLYRLLLVEASWRRTFASRIILRCWRSYQLNLKLDELKERWRVEKAALELADAQQDLKDIEGDLEFCLGDITAVKKSIKNAQRRRKQLVEFRKEAELRLHIVERHIENLNIQDVEGGWAENYDREWDMLTNCMAMALQEERIMQVKIAKFEQDLQILRLEIDDQEADMDEASTREFDRVEALRRMEITRGLELATKDRTRAVRRERMRWAVRDVRRKVIRRSRKDLERFAELAREKRPLEVEQTLSYEKRRDRERDEEAEVRRMERESRQERFVETKQKGEGNLAVREVYDAVISGVRDIIATASFEGRRAKIDYRGRGLDEVGPAASAAATAAAAAAREATGGASGDPAVDIAAAAAASEAAAAAVATGGAEPGGGKVCRACGGPRFGRAVCAKCGTNASSWWAGAAEESIRLA